MAAQPPTFSDESAHSGTLENAPADPYWRSLYLFNGYRLVVALLLLCSAAVFGDRLLFGSTNFPLFMYCSSIYVAFSVACFVLIAARRYFQLQIGLQVGADIVFVTVLMHASGGIQSGLGLLLLSGVAAAGLISRGRLTLFYAALASIAVLLEQTAQVLFYFGPTAQYVQAGLLSIAYFTTGGVAHKLAKYLVATEQLVAQREIDFANMAEISQLVIQDLQDGVLVVDEHRVIRQYNSQAELMLGKFPGVCGETMLSDYSPLLAQRLDEWRANHDGDVHTIMTLNEKASARFMLVGRSRDVGVVIVLEDLSRVQKQARQMKLAALGRLTANIAHEIRNPLSSINHAAELLQEEPEMSATVTRLLSIIHDNVKRLDRVVNNVLKLNRGERAHREVFEVGDYMHTFIEQFCQTEGIAQAMFALTVADYIEVSFDRSHLNQVMWNLCRNALRHCRRQSASIKIAIALDGVRNIVRLEVMDDGPGVPTALRNQLFEPFFTTVSSGTGLGLYIARAVCEANDATLDYVDESAGAKFTVLCRGA